MSTATLNNEKKKTLVPQLRFEEFNGEWKIDSLTNLFFNIVVGFVGTISNDYCDKQIGVQFIRTLNVKDGWFSTEGLQYVTNDFHKKNKKSQVKNGDILIARVGANMGQVCVINGLVGEANSANVIIIKSQENLSSSFYSSYLTSSKGQKQIQSKGAGGAQEVLNISVAKTIRVPFLNLKEQQKIASFLSAVDEKIQQLSRKKELLEQYKKGVMQQLFSGKLRFKDENGKDYPDWEEKKLGEVAKFSKGKGMSKSDISEDGINECIRYGELYTRYGEVIQNVFSKTNFDLSKAVVSKANDVIIPASGETQIDIATASCVMKSGVILGGDLNIIRTNNNGVFLSYYLNSAKKLDIANLAQGISVVHLYSSQLALLTLNFPILAEQQKIANFLSSIDTKIESTKQQITQTQTFKKGLLQQMFV